MQMTKRINLNQRYKQLLAERNKFDDTPEGLKQACDKLAEDSLKRHPVAFTCWGNNRMNNTGSNTDAS